MDFEEIYIKYFSDVYKYILTLCRNESIAEEITQETFFKALRHINKFNGDCTLYVWLSQIAKNTYFSFSKKRKHILIDADTYINYPDLSLDLERNLLDKEDARRLHSLLHNLKNPYKEVFTLRVFGELPFSQIGELFGNTDSWARLIFYRAKNQLKEKMK